MRRSILAAVTATAIALAPVQALAQDGNSSANGNGQQFENSSVDSEQSSTNGNSDASSADGSQSSFQDGEEFNLENSSYVEFLSSQTNDTTEDTGLNRFLAVLLDTAIGLGALLVIGGIYGEIAKLLPIR